MSEYLNRFFQRLKGLNLPPDIIPLGEEALREYLERTNKLHRLEDENAYLKALKDDFFKQTFCASLGGLRANPNITVREEVWPGAEFKQLTNEIIYTAIQDAQEAVRQVGELNKEQADDS